MTDPRTIPLTPGNLRMVILGDSRKEVEVIIDFHPEDWDQELAKKFCANAVKAISQVDPLYLFVEGVVLTENQSTYKSTWRSIKAHNEQRIGSLSTIPITGA